MSNYFITTEVADQHKFIARVYNKANNAQVYETQKHPILQNALNEANMFLKTNLLSQQPVPESSISASPKRCCGR